MEATGKNNDPVKERSDKEAMDTKHSKATHSNSESDFGSGKHRKKHTRARGKLSAETSLNLWHSGENAAGRPRCNLFNAGSIGGRLAAPQIKVGRITEFLERRDSKTSKPCVDGAMVARSNSDSNGHKAVRQMIPRTTSATGSTENTNGAVGKPSVETSIQNKTSGGGAGSNGNAGRSMMRVSHVAETESMQQGDDPEAKFEGEPSPRPQQPCKCQRRGQYWKGGAPVRSCEGLSETKLGPIARQSSFVSQRTTAQ
ncbi:hypothetical protein C8R45DRAFT_948106 [Mycena sanguinolenta]|nr:hypothetical protein C8R45DRAFT_948106 [Mycena sanguinolenta]